jgi:hypothetical protein|tara:strand:- start:482 stop:694 length:213 start_codon:yes stop_codon:yes gene_type:complete
MPDDGLLMPPETDGTFFMAVAEVENVPLFCILERLSNFFKMRGTAVAFFGVRNSTNFLLFTALYCAGNTF